MAKLRRCFMDKLTVANILAYIEKNCTEVEEVEEYLWRLLDKIEEDEHTERIFLKEY
jgi:hypothetical protein